MAHDFSFPSLLKSHLFISRKLGNSYFVNSIWVLITQLCEFRPFASIGKSQTLKFYLANFKDAFYEKQLPPLIQKDTVIIDFMPFLSIAPSPTDIFFKDYALKLFKSKILTWYRSRQFQNVHVIFDNQCFNLISPKDIERMRRDSTKDIGKDYDVVNEKTYTPTKWDTFLANRKNKKLLICFLCNQFLQLASTHLVPNETFYVNGGFENGYAFNFV